MRSELPLGSPAFSRSELMLVGTCASEDSAPSSQPRSRSASPQPRPSLEGPTRQSQSSARTEARHQKLIELVRSEHAYLADLVTITDVYLPALAEIASVEVQAAIARNVIALVGLHRRLCAAFDELDAELGWRAVEVSSATDDALVVSAAERIAKLYLALAPDFEVYQSFCAHHVDASSEVRTLTAALGAVDWLAFENRCVEAAVGGSEDRLHLADFLIKPIQRVMRYSLLMSSLARALPMASEARAVVERAEEVFRAVATRVDAARHARELDRRTVLVAGRIELPPAAHAHFLNFLGQLQLVGALQVVHIPPASILPTSAETRVKYYGVLLYHSHILFVKTKRTDCYEPRHWLPLRSLTIESIPDGEGLLPFSIRLAFGDHRFELGTLTSQERNVWSAHLLKAQAASRTAWLAAIATNPAQDPFDDTAVCSLIVCPAVADDANGAATPPITTGANVRHRLSSTASILLGKTPTAVRATVDMRLADVFSDDCVVARVQKAVPRRKSFASVEAASAVGSVSKAMKSHRRRLSADVVFGMLSNTLGGETESRPPFARKATSATTTTGRTTPTASRAPSRAASIIEAASERSDREAAKARRPSLSGGRSWAGSWRRPRTASMHACPPAPPVVSIENASSSLDASPAARSGILPPVASPTEELTLNDASVSATSVARNTSTSSSGSSASCLIEAVTPSPASSVPPSPLTPHTHPWYHPEGLKDVLSTFGAGSRKTSAASVIQLSPEQEEQAKAAEAFLRSGEVDNGRLYTPAAWRESWRKRRATLSMPRSSLDGPDMGGAMIGDQVSRTSSGRSSASSSFTPTLSPTLASPASPPPLPPKALVVASVPPKPLRRSTTDVGSIGTSSALVPGNGAAGAAQKRPNMLRRKSLRMFRLGSRFSPLESAPDPT